MCSTRPLDSLIGGCQCVLQDHLCYWSISSLVFDAPVALHRFFSSNIYRRFDGRRKRGSISMGTAKIVGYLMKAIGLITSFRLNVFEWWGDAIRTGSFNCPIQNGVMKRWIFLRKRWSKNGSVFLRKWKKVVRCCSKTVEPVKCRL